MTSGGAPPLRARAPEADYPWIVFLGSMKVQHEQSRAVMFTKCGRYTRGKTVVFQYRQDWLPVCKSCENCLQREEKK